MAGWSNKTILSSNALLQYILDTSYPKEHEQLKQLREATVEKYKERSMMNVPVDEGQFISLLLKLINAKKTMEIGVFTGYSLLTSALALPEDGKIIAIDPDKEAFEVGLPFMRKAEIEHKINSIHSDAFLVLDDLLNNGEEEGTFDFIFIDASKEDYIKFHELALKLVKIGGIIAYDNTLFRGSVAQAEETMSKHLWEIRNSVTKFNSFIATDPRVESSLLSIGDGLTLCMRLY